MANKENVKQGKTIFKYETGKHIVDIFGHYENEYYETGKVPKGFHI